MHLETEEITYRAIEYLMRVMKCSHYSWEFGKYCADVIGVNRDNRLVEIEVKRSKNDLLKDFEKFKHQIFVNEDKHDEYSPYHFYFMVPMRLEEYASAIVEGTPYGLLVYNGRRKPNLSIHRRVRVVKSPEIINNSTANKQIVSRMIRTFIPHNVFPTGGKSE